MKFFFLSLQLLQSTTCVVILIVFLETLTIYLEELDCSFYLTYPSLHDSHKSIKRNVRFVVILRNLSRLMKRTTTLLFFPPTGYLNLLLRSIIDGNYRKDEKT